MTFFTYGMKNPKACMGAMEVLGNERIGLRGTSEVLGD
jgi:hypothetical protein